MTPRPGPRGTSPARGAPPASGAPPTPRSAGEMLAMARAFLERKGVEEARLEADLLVAHALGLDRLGLLLRLEQPLAGAEIDRARDLLVRRGRREPVAYITGVREFYARPFRVEPGVLIPRPESELLVDLGRDHLRGGPAEARVLDLGTGSGCLGVTLALEVPGSRVTAVDSSTVAVAVAGLNARELGATLELRGGDGLEVGDEGAPWDLVVCNPPYVGTDEAHTLAPEVREYEPTEALFAPPGDPDYWVRELLSRLPRWLATGGALLVELGHGQATRALALARAAGASPRTVRDLAGVERALVVTARS